MRLKEIIESKFALMPEFLKAAKSGRYLEGVNNTGIYRLPNSLRADPIETFLQHGFGEAFMLAEQRALREEHTLTGSFVLLGPFNMNLVFDMWGGLKYFIENAHGFELVSPTQKTESQEYVKVLAFYDKQSKKREMVSGFSKNSSQAELSGNLLDNRRFNMHIISAMPDEIEKDFGLDGNYLYFRTSYEKDGKTIYPSDDRVNNWDIQLSGPTNHKIMREVIELGRAIKDYCIEMAREHR